MPPRVARRLVVAAAALLGLLGAVAEAAPARRGQVVRIERRRGPQTTGVHLCYQIGGRDHLVCIGERPPRIGSPIAVIGFLTQAGTSVIDVARVTRTEPARDDTCGSGRQHAVYYDLDAGAITGGNAQFILGLTGIEFAGGTQIDIRGAVRPPEVDPGDQVMGLDAAGDDRDLAISGRDCTGLGTVPGARRLQCLRYWQGGGGSWKVIGEDVLVECN